MERDIYAILLLYFVSTTQPAVKPSHQDNSERRTNYSDHGFLACGAED